MSCNQGCQDSLDCVPECNCATNDVTYNGANDTCTNIQYGSKLTEVLTKIITFTKNRLNSITGSKAIKVTPMSSTCSNIAAVDVIISPDADNQLQVHDNGLYVIPTPIPPPPPAYVPDYKLKVDADDTADYLVNQVAGDTDGIVTLETSDDNGTLKITPSINITELLNRIKASYGDAFCDLVATCVSYIWVADQTECEASDLDLLVNKTITSLPNPVYSFEDNGRLYFVSGANNVGKIWSLDPATATTVADIVYLQETRSGQPYGASGGTYTIGNYKANAWTGTGTSIIIGCYYDKVNRQLYIHSTLSFGCDYYDFNSATWGKVSIGSTGSGYNSYPSQTSSIPDYFTHIAMASNDNSDIIVTGWGVDSATRGSKVITISKSQKKLITEVDTTVNNTFAGITGNPFNHAWGAFITSDNRLFIGKANTSDYRNIAVFNSNLTPIIEIVLSNSNTGFQPSNGVFYWQNGFIDAANNKFYSNDYMSRTVEVYDTTTYALLKVFNLDNNRTYSTAQVAFSINPTTSELFWDITYGGTNQLTTDDAPSNELISYKVDRSTLDIEKIYIGMPKASNLVALDNGFITSTTGGDVVPTSPTTTGQTTFYIKNPNALKNGTVDVLTLKEVNSSTQVPSGNTKPNTVGDPNYIAPYVDKTLCPLTYTLSSPSTIVLTVTPSRYDVEFGLNDDVVLNPSLSSIKADLIGNGGATIASQVWPIPNTPNPNAFIMDSIITSGVSIGDIITLNLQYLDSSNTPLATFNGIKTFTAVANV